MGNLIVDKDVVLKNLLKQIKKEEIEFRKEFFNRPNIRLKSRKDRFQYSSLISFRFMQKSLRVIHKYTIEKEATKQTSMFED